MGDVGGEFIAEGRALVVWELCVELAELLEVTTGVLELKNIWKNELTTVRTPRHPHAIV